ncbi:MAG: hypothetical protein ABI882_15285 [Acidobacteriota bacterium]
MTNSFESTLSWESEIKRRRPDRRKSRKINPMPGAPPFVMRNGSVYVPLSASGVLIPIN